MKVHGIDHVQLAMPRGREDEARVTELAAPPPLASAA